MASNLSTVAYIFKKKYVNEKVQNLASRDRAFMSMVSKVGGFSGEDLSQSVMYANAQGVSNSLTDANTAITSTAGIKFAYTRARKLGIITLDAESMLASQDDAGAFTRLVTQETDSVIDEVGHQIAVGLYGDTTGAIGRRSSESADVTTLTNADDTKHFAVGMLVQAGTISGTTVTLRTGSTTITSVDEDAGTIGLDTSDITSYADDDYLFAYGTARVSGSSYHIHGLNGWLPLTAPTSGDSWFGVDRSVDVSRLAGCRVSSAVTDVEEKLITLAAKIQRNKGKPKHVFMNPLKWADLSKKLGSKVERDEAGGATMGFESIRLATPAGVVSIYSDPECPSDRAFMLDMSTWKLRYLGAGAPEIVKDDGLAALRGVASAASNGGDSIEKRVRFIGQLTCSAPGKNGVCDV